MAISNVHRLSCILLTCPAQVHFRLLICSIKMFVFLSWYVILTYSFPCLFVRLLVGLCLGGECACFRTVSRCWTYTRVVDLSLQACSNFTLEDVAVLGECCLSGHGSSLNRTFLSFVSGAVSLSQV